MCNEYNNTIIFILENAKKINAKKDYNNHKALKLANIITNFI